MRPTATFEEPRYACADFNRKIVLRNDVLRRHDELPFAFRVGVNLRMAFQAEPLGDGQIPYAAFAPEPFARVFMV